MPAPGLCRNALACEERWMAGWNNCLVENNGPSQRRVYMPTFGHDGNAQFSPLDDEMERLWEKEDFEVICLGDFNEFVMRDGVVHCITKYLSRSAEPASA